MRFVPTCRTNVIGFVFSLTVAVSSFAQVPTISSIVPSQARSGDSVTINGTGFGATQQGYVTVWDGTDRSINRTWPTTQGSRNIGPVELLPGNNNRDMGSFVNVCTTP